MKKAVGMHILPLATAMILALTQRKRKTSRNDFTSYLEKIIAISVSFILSRIIIMKLDNGHDVLKRLVGERDAHASREF